MTGGGGLSFETETAVVTVLGSRRAVVRRFLAHRPATWGLVMLALVIGVAVLGGWLWRYEVGDITDDLSAAPSWRHPMGTDGLGRDLFAQVLQGTRRSLQVAVVVSLLSTTFGAVCGALAGYYRGWVDSVLMRLTDVVLSVPGIAILVVIAGSIKGSVSWLTVALILSSLSWTGIARVVRGTVLSLREREFIDAARAAGAGDGRILVRHVLPHTSGPVLVKASLAVSGAVLAEAALSYLGLGISAPDTSLGRLVESGQHSATTRPWLFYFPGLVILAIVLSVNFVGDGLRDALDPTSEARGPRRFGGISRWHSSGGPAPAFVGRPSRRRGHERADTGSK